MKKQKKIETDTVVRICLCQCVDALHSTNHKTGCQQIPQYLIRLKRVPSTYKKPLAMCGICADFAHMFCDAAYVARTPAKIPTIGIQRPGENWVEISKPQFPQLEFREVTKDFGILVETESHLKRNRKRSI
jgi:hypothetical protein